MSFSFLNPRSPVSAAHTHMGMGPSMELGQPTERGKQIASCALKEYPTWRVHTHTPRWLTSLIPARMTCHTDTQPQNLILYGPTQENWMETSGTKSNQNTEWKTLNVYPTFAFRRGIVEKAAWVKRLCVNFTNPRHFWGFFYLEGKRGTCAFFNWLIWKHRLGHFWVKSQVRRSDRQQKWQHPGEGTLYDSLGIELTASCLARAQPPNCEPVPQWQYSYFH